MSTEPRFVIDLAGPDGNVFNIAGIAKTWRSQLDWAPECMLTATSERIGGAGRGTYEDALDTFDLWFKGKIPYRFVNDPREEDYGEGDYDEV